MRMVKVEQGDNTTEPSPKRRKVKVEQDDDAGECKPRTPKMEQNDDATQEEQELKQDCTEFEINKNDDGDAFLELSSKRRVTVRSFKKNILIDLREVGSAPHPY